MGAPFGFLQNARVLGEHNGVHNGVHHHQSTGGDIPQWDTPSLNQGGYSETGIG